jgi:hypothetical protein
MYFWFFITILSFLGCLPQNNKPAEPESQDISNNKDSMKIFANVSSVDKILSPDGLINPDDVVVAIQDIDTLNQIHWTHSLEALLPTTGEPLLPTERVSTQWLYANHDGYRYIAKHIQQRIDVISTDIERDLIIELKDALQYPAGNVGRRLDNRWFQSDIAFFELIGVINRLDKKDFYNTCGEIRFVYRLAYQNDSGVSSRLPLTLNIVMVPTETNCIDVASQWVRPKDATDDRWLFNNALNPENLKFKHLELNAQIIRFPSGLETEFAGQALYLLRIYGLDTLKTPLQVLNIPLENSPNVQALAKDAALKATFVAWINDNTTNIDNGTHLIPDQYLATEALSYSTLGIHRRANKAFDVFFDDETMLQLQEPTGTLQWIKSKESVIDRLNNSSCIGCHQASTTAGFHFLGADNPNISGVTNRLTLPFSAHFHRETSRRQQQLAQFINGETEHTFRPHSLAPNTAQVETNHSCILPEHQKDFQENAQWTCKENEICEQVVESKSGIQFGQCMPIKSDLLSGNTCRTGTITNSSTSSTGVFNLHAYKDTFTQQQRYSLAEGNSFTYDSLNCRPTRIGVPLGRAYRKCTPEERAFKLQQINVENPEICAVVGGSQFDSCVEKDFHKCLDTIVARGMVDSCHINRFCREDYICQTLPYQLEGVDTEMGKAIVEAGVGFCTPTYFVFQLRLDGHPVP